MVASNAVGSTSSPSVAVHNVVVAGNNQDSASSIAASTGPGLSAIWSGHH